MLNRTTLHRLTVGAEPRTPEEVAQDYDLPVTAVYEAIDYATHNQELLEAERAREEARMQQSGLHKPPFVPADTSSEEHLPCGLCTTLK
jgi:hypothetical protein